ncbi:MAG: inorganic pyrophosphatase [Gammaproteobacteria bacterium]|nr:inorganic pyrophosphatase [Gammaproteobacteria bacterium]
MSSTFNRWRPHPWHGIEVGPDAPSVVHAYIESTPFDHVKYEVDKQTGYLRVDRPHRTSSLPPTLYGFIPRTYCGTRVGALMGSDLLGDEDPLDICVISDRPVDRAELILNARVVGGLPMIDGGEADDKILAVLEGDHVWSNIEDISELPGSIVERLRHYFLTYKSLPGEDSKVHVGSGYGRDHAMKVIEQSMLDYADLSASLTEES